MSRLNCVRRRNLIGLVFTVVLVFSSTAFIPKAFANPVCKVYTPDQDLKYEWGFGIKGSPAALKTTSVLSNLEVRVYSNREIIVKGDFSAVGAALITNVGVQVLTSTEATVEVLSFTWNGLFKTYSTFTQWGVYGGLPRYPGANFVGVGAGSGYFEVKITNIAPTDDEGVFGVMVNIGNLGSALAQVWNLFKLMTVAPDAIDLIWQIKMAVSTGKNIASLLLDKHIYRVTDEWPTEPTPPPITIMSSLSGIDYVNPHAVFYDERYPTSWISINEARSIRDYLIARGFVCLNADDLKTFMENAGSYSVVVMAQDIAPDTVADVKSSSAIIRQYLDRGGRVVWLEDIPFYYQGHSDGTNTEWGESGMQAILGVSMGTWNIGDTVAITSLGSDAGLTQTWQSIRPVGISDVTGVYASASGGAAAWIKTFNDGEFRRIWDNGGDFISDEYLKDLITIATTGDLSWKVEMKAYNGDPIYARCGDININGYTKRIISWITSGYTATATKTVPGYWFNHEFNAVNAWVTTTATYDSNASWVDVKLTSPEGFVIQYNRMNPANLDYKAYFNVELTGLWHVTTDDSYTPPTALAYNRLDTLTYDTGDRTEGAFTFTVDLEAYASATLQFYHRYEIELYTWFAYDVLSVQISTDLGENWDILAQWDSREPSVETWTQVTLDLSSYCGNFVEIRFNFDSIDKQRNWYEGWYVDEIEVSGTISQNDAGTGGDAGNSFSTATSVGEGSYQGNLYLSFDTEDWYQFGAANNDVIEVSMTPPPEANFDLKLYDSLNNLKAESHYGDGITDTVIFTADSSGNWRIKIYIVHGEGQYSFSITVTPPGSCPYVYAWNGTDFVLIADVLGPSGLAYPDVSLRYDFRPPNPHDFAVIPGEMLQAVNGSYVIELAELRSEISYIDGIRLIAVDHPIGYEIYSPTVSTQIPIPFEYRTVYDPISPITATKYDYYWGNLTNITDILEAITIPDDLNYAVSDLSEAHVIELDFGDLGDLDDISEFKLITRGWSVWDSEHFPEEIWWMKEHPEFVQANHIEVINENGEWEAVGEPICNESYWLGHGAPRTTVRDIRHWLKTSDYRLRLHYWGGFHLDWIAVDITNTPLNHTTFTILRPTVADLYCKGGVKLISKEGDVLGQYPALPDWDIPYTYDTELFIGYFTRYGNVKPLLFGSDDMFVIMDYGDSIHLEFPEVPVPEGMERHYYFFVDGFFKENFVKYFLNNTVGTVDPLPFHDMTTYPYPENESYPDDPIHKAYLRVWNKRYIGTEDAMEEDESNAGAKTGFAPIENSHQLDQKLTNMILADLKNDYNAVIIQIWEHENEE